MGMVSFKHKGNFKKLEKSLDKMGKRDYFNSLRTLGQKGVDSLSSATPSDTGKTADSWSYEMEQNKDSVAIRWLNSNVVNGVNIALILQYGHGTGTGGYVRGRDYINPALGPVMDEIAEQAWKEVTST